LALKIRAALDLATGRAEPQVGRSGQRNVSQKCSELGRLACGGQQLKPDLRVFAANFLDDQWQVFTGVLTNAQKQGKNADVLRRSGQRNVSQKCSELG